MPFSKNIGLNSPPTIACVGNNLTVAIPTTGEIFVYDLEGKLKSKDKIEWNTNYISVEEQKEIQKKAIEKYKNIKNSKSGILMGPADESEAVLDYMIKEMEIDLNKISEPIPLPGFSTIIKDSDGNILFFEYPKAENANKFNVWVYENGGKFVCQSSFICDEYNLEINPSKMVFTMGIFMDSNSKEYEWCPFKTSPVKVTSN
jgi:hypothetical protein